MMVIAMGCQLLLSSMQLNDKLFLKGRCKQCISITVHRTFPLAEQLLEMDFAILALSSSMLHQPMKILLCTKEIYSRRQEILNTGSGSQVLGGGVRLKCARLGWTSNSTELDSKENYRALILPEHEKGITGR